ncbi:DNA methyltransferase [Pseudomonas sp. B22129]|uniref:DNA methyltransferase n=1 Tax=Pseudomonas sp. B22129 TaxID=3235111 RepID=UPI003784F629
MTLSRNEIRNRALAFSREWADESSESAEAKTFWDGFFTIFGMKRRRMASFEYPVKKSDGAQGFIDLLWKGVLLVEHKSRGKNLDRADRQARDYFPGLKDRDLPRYVLVSDFEKFKLYDLDAEVAHEFDLVDLHKNIGLFGFISGYESQSLKPEDPVNIDAAVRMGKLHDQLKSIGYVGHSLELYLVRLLFLLFSEDTGIFEKRQFQDYIEQRTGEDGSDLAHHLATLFHVLNTPVEERLKNLDEQLFAFPYVNGKLFKETLPPASFDTAMRETLLEACGLNWSQISPAVFGSLFQSIMDSVARRSLGAHYTTEKNILKLIKPLFLDRLYEELGKIRKQPKKLVEFHLKLAGLKFFDPACGCGNFLVIAYRELRKLEIEVLRLLYDPEKGGQLDISTMILLDVDQFYGIEIEEFPAQIAQVALWLTDHQMNMKISVEFGQYFCRLPLRKSAAIIHGNSLSLDWMEICGKADYILGNPPFLGKKEQSATQKKELVSALSNHKNASSLDYVSAWYSKAAAYMVNFPDAQTAFVSTNSITQGEQAGILWPFLLNKGVRINFAHRTFEWTSEARGKAAVHCVIIGFGLVDSEEKIIFEYHSIKEDPFAIQVSKINPYLVEADDLVLQARRDCLDPKAPDMRFGSMPNDKGHLHLTPEERANLLRCEPGAEPWLKRIMGSKEYINSIERWCLWLVDIKSPQLRLLAQVKARVQKVKEIRLDSSREETRRLADTPYAFGEIRQPTSTYIAVPKTSSENRAFIPIGFLEADDIANTELFTVAEASLYNFGILTSTMHMAWMRTVCGRLKSDYRYSAGIVYNNYPWPSPSEKQISEIELAAQDVLDARSMVAGASLADLYDPLSMPVPLVKAHQKLDRAVDSAYGKRGLKSEAERVSFLFDLHKTLLANIPVKVRKKIR